MKLIANILYLEWVDALEAGISDDTLKKAKYRGSNAWQFIQDPSDKRKVLIQYDSMRDKYKQLVAQNLCSGLDPYKWYRQQQEMAAVELRQRQTDSAKERIKANFLIIEPEELQALNDIPGMEEATAHDIARLAAMCRFYNSVPARRSEVRRYGFEKKSELQRALFDIARDEELPVPNNFRRFQDKFKRYDRNGVKGLVSKKYGNRNSQKLGDDQKAALRYMYSRPNNYGMQRVADEYNAMAPKMGWETVSYSTVKSYLSRPDVRNLCQLGRNGKAAWHNTNSITIQRQRPQQPCTLWVEDVWTVELYYQRTTYQDGRKKTYHWLRKKASVVIDALNDVILGYSLDNEENAKMKLEAWKQAVMNTGYVPRELKSDRWKSGEVDDLYMKMNAHVRLSNVGNARDKVIEPMFNRLNEQVLKDFPNWSGKNVTSRGMNSVANREYLDSVKRDFPTEDEVAKQFHYAVKKWNTMQRKDGRSLFAQWREGDFSDARQAELPHMIEMFGQQHSHTNSLRKEGLTPTIEGEEKTYRLHSTAFMNLIGAEFQLYYLPEDTSAVIAKDQYGQQWIVPEEGKAKMAFHDRVDGDGRFLESRLDFQKEHYTSTEQRLQQDEERARALGVYDHLNKLGAAKHYLPEDDGMAKNAANVLEDSEKDLSNKQVAYSSLYEDDGADGSVIE